MSNEDPRSFRDRIRAEPERFGDAVAGFRQRLRRMVELRMDERLRRRLDASDVVQEACAEAVERLPDWLANETLPLHLWLRLLTEQKLRQLHRFHLTAGRRDAGRDVPLDEPLDEATGARPERLVDALAESGVVSPSGVAVRAEVVARLHSALASMKAEDREILALRHFEQLDNVDVAQLLGLTRSGSSQRYLRAAKRLRAILGELSRSGR
jgi:RNA polymerase sigma-70 factor (ECF subfamily)